MSKKMKKWCIAIVGLNIAIGIFADIIFLNPGLPAQAADNILRPLIGNKGTIELESWYFGFGDQLNRLTYHYKKPNTNIFTSQSGMNTLVKSIPTTTTMNLNPIYSQHGFSQIPLEGRWQVIANTLFPLQTVLAKTFIRPDPSRDYAIVSLVKMNMKYLSIGLQAGTYYPGGIYGIYGLGKVPESVQQANSLIAVFNGGFMAKDGHYGMVLDNKTYVPLRKNLATLVIDTNGFPQIIDYQGQKFDSNVVAVRQNGAFLIQNGAITPFVENSPDTWGRTTTNSMYTWRSGIGLTKNGDLIYAVGNSLIPKTLAESLQEAGAITAMQLDINPYWVRYILYSGLGNGTYTYYPLLNDMHNGGYAYLHGYNKDFFYIYKKPSI